MTAHVAALRELLAKPLPDLGQLLAIRDSVPPLLRRLDRAEAVVDAAYIEHREKHFIAHRSAMQICTPLCRAVAAYRAEGEG